MQMMSMGMFREHRVGIVCPQEQLLRSHLQLMPNFIFLPLGLTLQVKLQFLQSNEILFLVSQRIIAVEFLDYDLLYFLYLVLVVDSLTPSLHY